MGEESTLILAAENIVKEGETAVGNVFHETEKFFGGLVGKLAPAHATTLQTVASTAKELAAKAEEASAAIVDDVLKYVEARLPAGPIAALADPIIDRLVAELQAQKTTAKA